MDIIAMNFGIREVVAGHDKESIFRSVRDCGGELTMSRRDADGGELIEFAVGSGKRVVKIQWQRWVPREAPVLMVASDDAKALAKVVAQICFGAAFFNEIQSGSEEVR
jgi:CMP-2-keto-3-deoxyoctulosonic acid synthetase